ncbi:CPBP family intramembrane glutamic endopeptidase [Nocardiopsis alborubida]|uniref:CPBP family intramembrane metalloprotease n=1 Tax=Nocardiopsis alborubida TaxID=146802 RepID=A0A7X6RPA7_9ACTN|nr:CPBP family intramembrane glutamic endopeptidase [Nocardiopsis alborubida]NKY97539.1 CPBP family intramembrane metalloprotease [Nocardiopsis alborubida]
MAFPPTMEFSSLGLGLAALVVLYLLVVEPWWGRSAYARLERVRDTDSGALLRLFGTSALVWWGLTAVVLLIVAVSPGLRFADVGFAVPEAGMADTLATMTGVLVAVVAGLALMRVTGLDRRLLAGQRAVSAMLPRDRRERWAAAGASVTAGVCEEVVFRGLLIALGVSLGLDAVVAAGLSLAVFAVAHVYQGRTGVVLVTLVGFGFTHLYLSTGSLLLPVFLHVLMDLRSLLVTPGRREAGTISVGSAR